MKKKIHYIIWLFCSMALFAACETSEPDLFERDANGAYFDYQYAADFEKTLNFSEHIVGDPDTVAVTLNVRLLGYLENDARKLSVKAREVEGFALAEVEIGEVFFAEKEYEKEIEVKVKRPEQEDSIYAVCIYLDGSGDIGTGIKGKDEFYLYVTESYEKPSVWYSHMDTYLGEWSKEKHIYLANHTGNNHFYMNLYDSNLGTHLFDSIVALNVSAVNALLAAEPAEPLVVDLPIMNETDYPDYTVPYFWGLYEEYLGVFRPNKFCRLTTMLGGSGTRGVAALFAGEAGQQKMKEEADNFHKADVLYMLNEYYRYASMGYPISEFRSMFWVKLRNNVNYNVRIPYWWEDPDNLGAADIVKRYFGEYQNDKYQFILKNVLKDDGEDNFVAESVFPFIYDRENGTFGWDASTFGKKQLSGEERLKECYRIVKAANDRRPKPLRFDIPEVAVD